MLRDPDEVLKCCQLWLHPAHWVFTGTGSVCPSPWDQTLIPLPPFLMV